MNHVVVLGGGSAGWITAGTLAANFSQQSSNPLKVTLVESPDVPIIGVGEGTWPSMRNTLKQMKIEEHDFIRACDVSFKQGSKFIGWKTGRVNDDYYHPFTSPPGYTQTNLYQAWRKSDLRSTFADTICAQSQICELALAPKQIATPAYAGVANYGYHLDAGKFSQFLKRHCIDGLGVSYRQDHIDAVDIDEQGDIASLVGRLTGKIHADLFIDCTGMQSLLLGAAL